MLILRCSSSAQSIHELVRLGGKPGSLLFLHPKAAKTAKELEFSFRLARESFREKSNVSEKIANEAMLFLACETNFTSAAKKVGAASAKDFLLVGEKGIPIAKLKKRLLLTKARRVLLPEWGKMKGRYSEGELAVERMALSRIRN